MKKVIKSSYSPTQRVHEILDILSEYGVDEHELLMQCLDWFPSADLVECFSDYARLADIPLDFDDESEYADNPRELDGIWDGYYGSHPYDETIDSSTKICGDSSNLKLDHWAVGAKVGDQIYDKLKDRIGEVVKTGQSGNYNLIYVDFNDGSKILKINPMDDAQRKGRFFLVLG